MFINSGLPKLPAYLNSLCKILVRCLEEKLPPTNPEGDRGVGSMDRGRVQDDLKTVLPMNPQLNIQPSILCQKMV